MPNLFVIAGPNGAGKSTSAPELLTGARRVDEFVNADVIARETNVSDIAAGRMTLHRLTELANARKDVAFETTLSGHLLLPRIRSMQRKGYLFHLIFFWLPSAASRISSTITRRRLIHGLCSTTAIRPPHAVSPGATLEVLSASAIIRSGAN